jgi:hypothetical protein
MRQRATDERKHHMLNGGRSQCDIQEGSVERQSHTIILCAGEETQHDGPREAELDTILIGSMPCKLSSEVHVGGHRIFGH